MYNSEEAQVFCPILNWILSLQDEQMFLLYVVNAEIFAVTYRHTVGVVSLPVLSYCSQFTQYLWIHTLKKMRATGWKEKGGIVQRSNFFFVAHVGEFKFAFKSIHVCVDPCLTQIKCLAKMIRPNKKFSQGPVARASWRQSTHYVHMFVCFTQGSDPL